MSNGVYGKSLRAWLANSTIEVKLQFNPFVEYGQVWNWVPSWTFKYSKDNYDEAKVYSHFSWLFLTIELVIDDGKW